MAQDVEWQEGEFLLVGPVINNECALEVYVRKPAATDDVFTPLRAIIDTGATASAIRSECAEQIGLPVIDQARVGTAAGPVERPVVAAGIAIKTHGGGFLAGMRAMTSMDLGTVDVLFGMDFLAGGVLVVDYSDFAKPFWHITFKRTLKPPEDVRAKDDPGQLLLELPPPATVDRQTGEERTTETAEGDEPAGP